MTITAGASQNANAASVAAFLDHYFAAINNHDYQSYVSLLSPQAQQGLTAAQFDSGYRSTADSAETLVGDFHRRERGSRRGRDLHQSPEPGGQPGPAAILYRLEHLTVPGGERRGISRRSAAAWLSRFLSCLYLTSDSPLTREI